MKIGRREFAARNMWHNYHYHRPHHMWYLRHTGKVLAGTDDMEMTMGARMALAGVIFLRLIPYTVWTRNMLWSQKINVNLLSKYQLLVRETEQTQLLCLVDNYCEVFLGILSILAVGGISVYLSGENLDKPFICTSCKLFGKRAFQKKFCLRDLVHYFHQCRPCVRRHPSLLVADSLYQWPSSLTISII